MGYSSVHTWSGPCQLEVPVIFFTFLGLVPAPVESGKIAVFFLKLGKLKITTLKRKMVYQGYFESYILSNSNNCFHFFLS